MTDSRPKPKATAPADAPRTGLVLEIQRMSTEDGPGIRTTVFFKGCPLRCRWCHNPESISPRPEIVWHQARCLGCQTCLEVCPEKALSLTADGLVIDRNRCRVCGTCAEECPSTALEKLGTYWTAANLAREAAKDRAYFNRSGGGITASGGEAGLQAEFVADFLAHCQSLGLRTALDTSGHVHPEALETLAGKADLILFDLKEIDIGRHKAWTGQGNRLILDNFRRLAGWIDEGRTGAGLWVRTPLIPGATDRTETVRAIGRFIAEQGGGRVERWELCAFNNLCREKYNRLGLTWDFAQAPLMPRADLEALAETARASGVNPGIVQTGGATRLEALDRSGSSGPGDSPDRPRPDLRLIQGGRSTSQLDDSTAEPKPQPREVTP